MTAKENPHNHKASSKQLSPQTTNYDYETNTLTQPQISLTTLIQRVRLNPSSLTPHDVQQLQRTIGNSAIQRLFTHQMHTATSSLRGNMAQNTSSGQSRIRMRTSQSGIQRQIMSRDWEDEAAHLTTSQLEDEIQAMRLRLGNAAENSDEVRGLTIFERTLRARQQGYIEHQESASDTRGRQRETIENTEGDLVIGAATLRINAEAVFISGFMTGYRSEIPPGEIEDFGRELQESWPQFELGYKVGAAVGLWHGLTGFIEGIGSLIELGLRTSTVGMLTALVGEAAEFADNPDQYIQNRRRDYMRLQAIANSLRELAEEFQADPTVIIQLSSDLGLAFGQELGQLTTTNFLRQTPYQKGYIIGDIAGQIAFEVLLEIIMTLATEGIGNLLRGIAVVGQGARTGGRVANIIRRILEASPALRRLFRILSEGEDVADVARLGERGADAVRTGGDEALEGGGRLLNAGEEGGDASQRLGSTVEDLSETARTSRSIAGRTADDLRRQRVELVDALDQLRSHPDSNRMMDALDAAEDLIQRGKLDEADTLLHAVNDRVRAAQYAAEEGAFSSHYGGATEGRLTETSTRQGARVGLAENHHIATRFRTENRDLLNSVGLDIDNDLNLIRQFEEHGQLRGWYDWDSKVYQYRMRGHHPEYNRWVTNHLTEAAPRGLLPDQALRRIVRALQRLDRIIRQHPDVLAYGPRILPPRLRTLTP